MKKILGLDLGTTSIGWAFVKEAEDDNEVSSIIKIGVRVNPLTTDEQTNFEKGKKFSVTAGRTLARGARRSLQRYKQRRQNLINVLKQSGIIDEHTLLAESEKSTTHATYALRAKAADKKIGKDEFARILLMINKKRGYKSSRKVNSEDEGQLIDGMGIANRLYEQKLTPGQLCYQFLKEGKKTLPDFYRSDLNAEFNRVWGLQSIYYPDVFNDDLKKALEGKGQKVTSAIFWAKYNFNTAENKGTREDKKLQAYKWRSMALNTQLAVEEAAFVIADINGNINNSSGYLGAISDRSKELYFNKQTIGQYLYRQLEDNPHTRTKGQVFYRQDYFDEFETIWETQAKYYPELTNALKEEIRDIVIFYQRKLKSQKGLVSFCEFESKVVELVKDGKKISYTIGAKVMPKSSPLFQEFKIWQNLNNLLIQNRKSKEILSFDLETKLLLFNELNIKGNLKKEQVFKFLGYKPNEWDLNFPVVEGNRTNQLLYEAYLKIMVYEGHDDIDIEALTADGIMSAVRSFFEIQGINGTILDFDSDVEGTFEKQPSYKLWHLLYAYEGDNSTTGNDKLFDLLNAKFGIKKEHAKILATVNFSQDYASLSAKAIRNILPFMKAGHPFAKKDKDEKVASATALAGYNHSSSIRKEENDSRILKDFLELLPKNSLRNPVVEKILNQMVNVVNAIIANPNFGKPDEIRIELARELKKNLKEREEATAQINKSTAEHEAIRLLLVKEFGIKNPTRNDIIRYKLYDELKFNGYKDLYTNEYISREELFSKKYDIEHIIPQSRVFDDSFSNKTIVERRINQAKDNATAYDYVDAKGAEKLSEYKLRVEAFLKFYPERKGKYKKLMMQGDAIGEGFIDRDLRDSQYIAKKAKDMLHEVCRNIVSTTGSVTQRLREDWDLVNVMQELNLEKYRKQLLTEMVEKKDGNFKERIIDWTKRNDHRHHAMDALTIAFTKHSHIQYLNNLNARKSDDKLGRAIAAIEKKETYFQIDDNGNKRRRFKSPIANFREDAKNHLENVLVSCKAKNKVVTKNKNKIKSAKENEPQKTLTPRGQLHKETVYGKIQQYIVKEEKVSGKFDEATIAKVTKPKYREALLKRLRENNNDPAKAFTGKNALSKSPIYLDAKNIVLLPEVLKLSWLEDDYAIRKDISPDLKIEKVVDEGIREILYKRLNEFGGKGKEKEAFTNLDKNPIWLNEAAKIAIKRVTISGVKNAEPLHFKKDHHGRYILDKSGKPSPVDFVSTGNNHHVAIYRDEDGNLQDEVVSLYKVITERVNQGLPIVDKTYNRHLGWQFLFTMKQNEYFIFPSADFNPLEIDLLNPVNNRLISSHLFRVQKFSKLIYGNSAVREYVFRHHLETSVDEKKQLKDVTFRNIKSLPYLENVIKIRVNHIGQIVKIGEY
jgi:CRISPR-associated endonuclease Csn1